MLVQQDINRAIVLMGPRRVGKTVMAFQAIDALLTEGISPYNVLYRTLEVLGTYLSHPMVRRLADIEQCQTQAENVLEQLGLDNKKG
jgi:predicted AAA+ superfamily ATPase